MPLLFAMGTLIHHLTTILDQIDWEEPCDDFERKIIFSFTSNNIYFSTLRFKKNPATTSLFVIFNNTTQHNTIPDPIKGQIVCRVGNKHNKTTYLESKGASFYTGFVKTAISWCSTLRPCKTSSDIIALVVIFDRGRNNSTRANDHEQIVDILPVIATCQLVNGWNILEVDMDNELQHRHVQANPTNTHLI